MDKKPDMILRKTIVARDLSESLGKLPPQAVDMEEAVLGGLLLETNTHDEIAAFLRPEHFYIEAHKVIYNAFITMYRAGDKVDMRTISNHLRKTGKIDMVGGMYYIAELSTKVSSAANIISHARIIIEMSIKRQLILIASDIHHDAYEDTSDAIQLLEEKISELQKFKDNATGSNGAEKIKELWMKTMITIQPPPVIPIMHIDDSVIATKGNHSLLVGKKKSRKTLFITWLISKYLKNNPKSANSVLIFDTEQGQHHVFRLREKIHTMTGCLVPVFYLRGQSPAERRDFIALTVAHWEENFKTKPEWVVIDGIRDLMSNINDPDETTETIVWLEKLTLNYNVHVSNVLHLNKTDNNARGHIGSELLNKAEVTIELELDPKTGVTIVKCESSREKPFEHFAFQHDQNGLPEIVGVPIQGNIIPVEEKNNRWNAIFGDGLPLKYKDIIQGIKDNFSCGTNKAGSILAEAIRNGYIVKIGKSGSPDTIYKHMMQIPKMDIAAGQVREPDVKQVNTFDEQDPNAYVGSDELPF